MPSFYSIVRYVPDPVNGECINIGVLAFDESEVRSRFLRDWGRVRQFTGADPKFLRALVSDLGAATGPSQQLPGIGAIDALTGERIRALATSAVGSIQISTPRASTLSVDHLVDDLAGRMLQDSRPQRREYAGHQKAARLAFDALFSALSESIGPRSSQVLNKKVPLQGQLEGHTIDIAIKNGKLFAGTQGFAFSSSSPSGMNRDIDALAWFLDDVRKSNPDLPLSVVALFTSRRSNAYERVQRVVEGLKATFVQESQLTTWSREIAGSVSAKLRP